MHAWLKKVTYFLMLLVTYVANSYSADNVIENLAEAIIDKQLPYLLHEHKDKRWELGTYNLKIERTGKPTLKSNNVNLELSFPINALMTGKIKKKILGTKITIGCNSRFDTTAKVNVTPTAKPAGYVSEVNISIHVPPTDLKCDGVRIPIKSALDTLIKDEKNKWESDLETNINNIFKQVGI